MKILKLFILTLLSLFIFVGCSQKQSDQVIKNPLSRTEFLMGTVVNVKIFNKGKEAVLDQVFDRMSTLDTLITTNDDASQSEVNLINENAGIHPVKVSEDLFQLIVAGKTYSQLANGSFDITIGPLSKLWHIGYPDERKPSQAEIDAILPLINYEDLILDKENQTVYLKNEGMSLDLGAIAKGFITDEVVKILKANGVTSAVVDLGGNIYVLGQNPSHELWTVGIQNPFLSRGETVGTIQLSNKSVVTSGIYERYLEIDGVRYHHLLNPLDGYPFNNEIAGVSVITDQSIDGDSLSTLLFSKGVEEGLELVEKIENVDAIFITRNKEIYLSSNLKGKFKLTNNEFQIVE